MDGDVEACSVQQQGAEVDSISEVLHSFIHLCIAADDSSQKGRLSERTISSKRRLVYSKPIIFASPYFAIFLLLSSAISSIDYEASLLNGHFFTCSTLYLQQLEQFVLI